MHRVAEVWVPAVAPGAGGLAGEGNGPGIVGTGYLVAARAMLTARHVVEAAIEDGSGDLDARGAGPQVSVRPLGTRGASPGAWLPGRVVWDDERLDVALVEVLGAGVSGIGPAALAEVAGDVRVTAVGFPVAGRRPGRVRDTDQAAGEVLYGAGWKRNRLVFDVRSAVAQLPAGAGARSGWEGISGAGLLAGDRLAGIVVADHAPQQYQGRRLEVVPIAAIVQAAGFSEAAAPLGVSLRLSPVGARSRGRLEPASVPKGVVDRPGLRAAVAGALTAAGAPVVVVAGPPGFGKTTLALQACRDPSVAAHWPGGVLWLTLGEEPDLAATLAQAYADLTGHAPAAVSAEDFAQRIGDELAGRAALLVIDDAWDQASLDVLLSRTGSVPRLVTTRNRTVAGEWADTVIPVDEPLLPSEAAAVLAPGPGLDPAGEPSVARLAGKIGGWPLLLGLASGQLRRLAGSGLSLAEAARRLDHLYTELGAVAFDARRPGQRRQAVMLTMNASLGQLSPEDRRRYAALSVFSPADAVPLQVVAGFWGLAIPQAEALLADLADLSMLRYDLRDQTTWLHQVIRDFLQAQLPDMAALHADLVTGWGDPRALGDRYRSGHVTWHMAQAGQSAELFALVDDLDWYAAQLRRDPSGSAYLRDLRQVLDVAANADQAAIVQTGSAPLLAREIRYAMMTAGLHSRSKVIPAKLLPALVDAGLWTPTEALAVVKQNPSSSGRGHALRLLGPQLPGTVLRDALDVARGLDYPDEVAAALAALIPLLPSPDQEAITSEALGLARGAGATKALAAVAGLLPQPARDQVLREAWDQVIARNEDPEDGFDELLTLWQAAPGTTLAAEALLATAYAIEDPDARANALGSLAEDDTALSVAQRAVVAGDAWAAVAEIDDLPERKDALVRLADAVPESLLGDAVRALLEAAGNAGHGGYYTAADVLAAALRCAARMPSFPDGLLRDARDRAAALTKPVSKATALAAIAQAAPGLEQDALMAEASQAISEMPIDARPHALARLLAYAPDACKDDVFRSLQEAARTLEPAPARAKALREVAVLILEPDPVQRALLREAHEITPVVQGNPEPDDAEFVLASAMLAARLPPEQQMDLVTDMLPVARQIDDPHDRARALAALIAFLPVAGQREVAAEVLDAADQVDEPEWAAEDLAAIIPYLEGTQRDRVLTEAAECVRAIPTDVVSRLKSAILDASEGIIGDVDFHFSGPRVRAQQAARLSALAPPGELKEQLMREAVDAVYASVYSQADTVIAVSPYLSEAAVRQLLAAIRAVPQEPFRAQVMAALLARLAELESPPSAHSQATAIWGSAIPEVVLAALESPEANEAHNPPDEPSTAVDEAAQMASPRSFDVTVEFIARTEDWLSDLFTLVGGDPPIVASMTAAPAGIDEEGRKDIERQFLDAFIAHTCAELPLDEVARVLRRAVEFTHDPQWTRAKAALISRLVGLGCTPAALEEARIAWPAIPPAQGFAAIASLLEPSARRQLTAQILAVTGQIEDPMERADALCAITRHLPASSLGPALEYIEQVIGDQLANIRRPNDITPELARLLSAIPPGRRLPAWQQVLRAASRGSRRQLLMHLPALMAAAEGLHTGQLYEDVSKYLLEVRKAPRL